MKQEKIESENGNDQTQQNIWDAETGITNKQLTYSNFDEFDFETKVSILLQHGGIVGIVHQDDFVVLLCLYNGFYTELFADPATFKLVYMQPASTFALMKFIKNDLAKGNTQILD